MKKDFVAAGFLYNPATKSFLLHHRDAKAPTNPNKWGFFGGSGEMGEKPVEAFVRELKEELNIDIEKSRVIPVYDYFVEENNVHRYVFYVESDLDKSKMTLLEGQGFDWIQAEDVFKYDLHTRALNDLKFFLDKKIWI